MTHWGQRTWRRGAAVAARRPPRLEALERRTLLSVELVQDINTLPVATSGPLQLADVNGTVFFTGTDAWGTELWKTDGTAAGTVRVADLHPGTTGSNPAHLTNFNGSLLFSANAPSLGRWLWRSDGTEAGTYRLANVYPPPNTGQGAPPNYRIVVGGDAAWFFSWDTQPGRQLWRTDGTVAGTRPVVTIPSITPGTTGMVPRDLTYLNGTLYFVVDGDEGGIELWKSDGTQAGTARVKDINPGPAASSPAYLTVVNNALYFTANDGVHGFELWKSDGTEAGTVMVRDIRPGAASSVGGPSPLPNLAGLGGTLFFAADNGTTGTELWKSDGTEAGTVLVRNINPGNASSTPSRLTPFNGAVYFGATNANGRELWRSDGTADGTAMVKDLYPFNPGGPVPGPDEIVVSGGAMYILSRGSGFPLVYLWKSDGTTQGTVELRVFSPDSSTVGTRIGSLTPVAGGVVFAGYDPATGLEPWRSDGTVAGTGLLKDVHDLTVHSRPGVVGEVNGRLLIAAINDNGITRKLYVTDGGPGGVQPLRNIPVTGGTLRLGDYIYFGGTTPAGSSYPVLYKTDGTTAGTVAVKSLSGVGLDNTSLSQFTQFGGQFYFTTDQRGGLWRSDGTDAGTVQLFAGELSRPVQIIGNVGGQFLFGGYGPFDPGNPARPYGLWKTDGTREGTILIAALQPAPARSSTYFRKLDDDTAVFFAAAPGPGANMVLWRTDGTPEGTAVVADLFPGDDWNGGNVFTAGGIPTGPEVIGGKLYFRGADLALWVTDGTAQGTRRIAGVTPADLTRYVEHNGSIYFTAQQQFETFVPTHLYRTDGTAAGTVRGGDFDAVGVSKFGDTVYVTGTRPGVPLGLWRMNAAGDDFSLVSPLATVPLRQFGDWVYFSADDGTHGHELWRATAAGPTAPPAVVDSTFVSAAPGPQRLELRTSDEVTFFPRTNVLLLTNLDTGETVSALRFNRTFDPATNTLSFTFPYQPGGRLSGGRWRATLPSGAMVSAASGDPLATDWSYTFSAPGVVARHLFYNNSWFDGFDTDADARDDAAIATDKSALRSGTGPGFMHVSSYSRGINGIMVDIAGLAAGSVLTTEDFDFQVGSNAGEWRAAPAPSSITVRPGAGVGGSDRVTIVWPDLAIRNTWLRVTVKPTARTNLAPADVFQFGSLVGESGNDRGRAFAVNVLDVWATRLARLLQSRLDGVVTIDHPFDFNRDRSIDARDEFIARLRSGTLSIDSGAVGPPPVAPLGMIAGATADVLSLSAERVPPGRRAGSGGVVSQ